MQRYCFFLTYARVGAKKRDPKVSIFYQILLRCHTIDVSWEHGAFLHIRYTQEASGDALKADGEAAVRGHAVAEGLLSESESIRIHATTEHLHAVVGFSVPLSLSPSRAPQARISPAPQRLSARLRRAYPAPRMAYPRPAHIRSYEVYFPTPNSAYPARLHKIYGLSP